VREQDFRHSRRRDFDADSYQPQPRAFGTRPRFNRAPVEAPSGPPVSGVVKWFSPEKGFGFVELSDGSGDAFLHGSVLAQGGIAAVQPGETLEVRVGPGHKGPHVTQVLSVDGSTATPTLRPTKCLAPFRMLQSQPVLSARRFTSSTIRFIRQSSRLPKRENAI
jgi:cold shock CspA family protein